MDTGVPQPRVRPSRTWARAAVLGLLVGLFLYAGQLGCNEQARYRVLSFFFDGVPSPEGTKSKEPEKIIGPFGAVLDPNDPRAAAWIERRRQRQRQRQTAKPEEGPFFNHEPYRSRQCSACHGSGSVQTRVTADARMCSKCHTEHVKQQESNWVHGPVALGHCELCHEPHRSRYRHLLIEPLPDICLSCHVDPALQQTPFHRAAATLKRACTDCHDPHMAGNRLLLIDSGAYARRKPDFSRGVVHQPFRERKCNACHKPEQSNVLVDNVEQACLSCHKAVLDEPTGGALHAAVREKKCLTCHEPHKSSRPHLIRRTAEKMCYTCHEVKETRMGNHPRVEKADCLLCHRGHASFGQHMLQAGIPGGPPAPAPPDGAAGQDERPTTRPDRSAGELISPPLGPAQPGPEQAPAATTQPDSGPEGVKPNP